jgi:hydrogenase nickel incorporation protein HypA/HybF
MHEMGITQGILSASFDAAKQADADCITEIRVSVGELTEIQEFALQFAFEALTPGTMAEGATLVVAHIPATSKCNECGLEYAHDRFEMLCPECGTFNVTPLTGREMRIDSIETPDAPDDPEQLTAPDTRPAGGTPPVGDTEE